MKHQTIAIVVLSLLLVGSWIWFLSSGSGSTRIVLPSAQSPSVVAGPQISPQITPWSDQLAELQQVPEGSPQYARAQRLIGFNVYGVERGDWAEAKKHVDLALKASPDDPKVLEDAGRVYLKVGKTAEGTEMLKRADTPVARHALAKLRGT